MITIREKEDLKRDLLGKLNVECSCYSNCNPDGFTITFNNKDYLEVLKTVIEKYFVNNLKIKEIIAERRAILEILYEPDELDLEIIETEKKLKELKHKRAELRKKDKILEKEKKLEQKVKELEKRIRELEDK